MKTPIRVVWKLPGRAAGWLSSSVSSTTGEGCGLEQLLLLQDGDKDKTWYWGGEPYWTEWGVWVSKGRAVFARVALMCCPLCEETWETSVSSSSSRNTTSQKREKRTGRIKILTSSVPYLCLPFSWEEKNKITSQSPACVISVPLQRSEEPWWCSWARTGSYG